MTIFNIPKERVNYFHLKYPDNLEENIRNVEEYNYTITVKNSRLLTPKYYEEANEHFVITNDTLFVLRDLKYKSKYNKEHNNDCIYITVTEFMSDIGEEIQDKLETYLINLKKEKPSVCNEVDKSLELSCNENSDEEFIGTHIPDSHIENPALSPDYYKGKTECWDYIADHNLDYFRGTAVKHITRAGLKDGNSYVQDIGKAIKYLEKAIEVYEKCVKIKGKMTIENEKR